MREIKFRGKRIDNGEWIYGYYWDNECGNHFIRVTMNNRGEITIKDYEVIHETVGQYTGLKDNKGIDIYEGDILITLDFGYKFVVEFKNGCFGGDYDGFSPMLKSIYGEGGKIIGNIYDNPELLEV